MQRIFFYAITIFFAAALPFSFRNQALGQGASLPQEQGSTSDVGSSKGTLEVVSGHNGLDANRYMSEVFEKLNANRVLQPSNLPGAKSGKLVLEFVILRDGNLDSAKVVKSTVDEATSQSKLDALRSSAPFPALPPEFKGKSLKLRLHSEFLPPKGQQH